MAIALGAANVEASPRPVELRDVEVRDGGVFGRLDPGAAPTRLTLEPRLQRAAERLLARSGAHEAAIVASDPRTGRILAWASRGARDYVASSFAPAASLFKIATAAALLGAGRATSATRECYEGGEHAITRRELEIRGGECTTLGEALGHSVNAVFAKLARKYLSAAELRLAAQELGFSGTVPIDVPVGPSALDVPDDPFGLARAAAGFWNGRLTPLGALAAMQTIANDGERLRFSLLERTPTRVSAGRAISVPVARALRQMLEVTTRRGTAAKAFHHADGSRALPHVSVAAKTGTLIGGEPARMFSWFAAFAPASRAEIAVAVMLGNDLTWRTKANVVGRELLEAYFQPESPARASVGTPVGRRR